jgi:hypothetical protein
MNPLTPGPFKAQDELLTRSLQSLAADIAAHQPTPAAHPIWLRAQRERRRLAIERATRPLRIIESLAFLCALLLVAFLLRQSASALMTPTALELGGIALAIVLGGCLVLLHLARKPSTSV